MQYTESSADSDIIIKKPKSTDEHNYHKLTLSQQSYILACQRKDHYAIQQSINIMNTCFDRANKTIEQYEKPIRRDSARRIR
jgi:hypothetical protein